MLTVKQEPIENEFPDVGGFAAPPNFTNLGGWETPIIKHELDVEGFAAPTIFPNFGGWGTPFIKHEPDVEGFAAQPDSTNLSAWGFATPKLELVPQNFVCPILRSEPAQPVFQPVAVKLEPILQPLPEETVKEEIEVQDVNLAELDKIKLDPEIDAEMAEGVRLLLNIELYDQICQDRKKRERRKKMSIQEIATEEALEAIEKARKAQEEVWRAEQEMKQMARIKQPHALERIPRYEAPRQPMVQTAPIVNNSYLLYLSQLIGAQLLTVGPAFPWRM